MLPGTMLAIEMQGSGSESLRVVERPVPRPGPLQALCRVEAVSVGAFDLEGDRRPIALGHEGSLRVVETGARVGNRLRAGQRLVVLPSRSEARRGGQADPCSLLAQYVLLREDILDSPERIVPISAPPSDFPHCGAALAEPLARVVAAHAHLVHILSSAIDGERTHRAGILPGGVALILGADLPGILHVVYAFLRRPRLVLVCDPRRDRREAAIERLRARAEGEGTDLEAVDPSSIDDALMRRSAGAGVDDVLVTGRDFSGIEDPLRLVARGGCLVFCAQPGASGRPGASGGTRGLDPALLHERSIVAAGSGPSGPADLRRAVELQERGALDLSPLVSAVGNLSAAPAALRALSEGRLDTEAVIYPHATAGELIPVQEWGPEAEALFVASAPLGRGMGDSRSSDWV